MIADQGPAVPIDIPLFYYRICNCASPILLFFIKKENFPQKL